ncbi:MAG: hypothetical protein HY738_03350 [Bacteroidia bacterium]|nr:hypothetical protein [Bacteroidia bacterium]
MKTLIYIIVFVFLTLYAMSQTVYTVTKMTDVDPFLYPYNFVDSLCDPEMYGTLQWAFRKANDTPGPVIIVFDISGAAPYYIVLSQQLPMLEKDIAIDGSTQTGWQPGQPVIIVDGQGFISMGFFLYNCNNSIIKGIRFDDFMDAGIIATVCTNLGIYDNVVTRIDNGSPINAVTAMRFSYSSGLTVKGNYIGTDYYLTTGIGIKDHGLYYDWGTQQTITGGTSSGEGNTIAYCGSNGFGILDGTGHLISGNRIFNNYRAILMRPGVNNDKQPPVITGFAGNTVTGTTQPGDIIEIFGSTGAENANEYLISVTADVAGNWTVNITTGYGFVVATATDAQNNTSVLSYAQPITVLPVTKLSSEFCGVTNVVFDQLISAEPIAGATGYQFHVENIEMQFNETLTTSNTSFRLIDLNKLVAFNTSYNIRVKVLFGTLWSDYGEICTVTTSGPIPGQYEPGYTLNGQITDNLTGDTYIPPMYVYDRFGDSTLLENVRIIQHTVQAGLFNLHFVDEDQSSGIGFDPTALDGFGNARRNVIIQVFRDLSELISGNYDSNTPYPNWVNNANHGLIEIEVKKSNEGMPDGAIGKASQLYLEAGAGISYGNVWEYLNTGIDPYFNLSDPWYMPGSFYHGYVQFKFTNNLPWNYNMTAQTCVGEYDFYSVILHEAMHILGFASSIQNDNGDVIFPDRYYFYDTYLENTAPTDMLNNTDNGCYVYNFTGIDISNACNMQFNNNAGFTHIVHSPSVFAQGTSLSHINCVNIPTDPLPAGYVMNFRADLGYIQRSPHTDEVTILCSLGYDITGNYGDATFWPSNPNNYFYIGRRTYTACNNNNLLVAGVNDFRYHNTFNTGLLFEIDLNIQPSITIPYLTIRQNDHNADGVSCLQPFYPSGGTLVQGTTDFTYTPPPAYSGRAMLRYRPRHINGQLGNITSIFINIIPPDLPLCTTTTQCTENIVCYGDFDDFAPGDENQLQAFAAQFRIRNIHDNTPNMNLSGVGSSDCGDPANTSFTPVFASPPNAICVATPLEGGVGNEGVVLPLKRPIFPNMTGTIQCNAAIPSAFCNNFQHRVRIYFSDVSPIDLGCNTYATSIINGPCPGLTLLGPFDIPINSTVWTPIGPTAFQNGPKNTMNFIIITTFRNAGPTPPPQTHGRVYIDDVQVLLDEIPLIITSNVSPSNNLCPGDNFTISYQICAPVNNIPAGDVILNYHDQFGSLPSSFTINPLSDFNPATGQAVIHPADWNPQTGCVNLNLDLTVNGNAIHGLTIHNIITLQLIQD